MHSLEESAAATAATESAVIVPVPAAEALVGGHRRRLDRSAGWLGRARARDVLYPFLTPEDVDEAALTRLSAALASVPEFDCTFATTAWFGTEVLWLAPAAVRAPAPVDDGCLEGVPRPAALRGRP